MNVLSLEASASEAAMCALQVDDGAATPRAVALLPQSRRLAEEWPAVLDEILTSAGWKLEDVDALAVGLGPGSWTGLRIALTAWKTLAQTRDLPLVGVPTFDAIAQAAWRASMESEESEDEHRLILVCAPCRPGEIYGKIFESHPDYLLVAQDEWIGAPAQMVDALFVQSLSREISTPPIVVGNDEKLLHLLHEAGEDAIVAAVPTEMAAMEIALAGALRIQNGEADDALSLQPLYLAPSAAERNLPK